LKAVRVAELMTALAWRFRVQENVFCLAAHLLDMNLLEFDAFELPMDFSNTSASVDAIVEGLGCFELGQECLQSDPM
jgi:hypothetical protein